MADPTISHGWTTAEPDAGKDVDEHNLNDHQITGFGAAVSAIVDPAVAIEATARAAADTAEVTARNSAISTAVATEATARASGDTSAIATAASDATTKANAAQAAAIAAAATDATTKANAAQAAAIAASDPTGSAAAVTTTSIGAVPTSRQVIAGTGLTGGGSLAADRTLVADFGSAAGKVTQGNDSRLSDTRTPTDASVTAAKVAAALKPSGSAAAGDESLRALGTSASTAAAGNDSRLSDTRTPTDASVTDAKIATTLSPSKITGTAVVTADSRLSDARTPTAHAASHKAGGSDSFSGVQNGFAPLSSGLLVPVSYLGSGTPDGTKFLRDDGVFATPAGGGAGGLVLLESHTASSSATIDFTTRNASGQSGATFQSDFDEYLIEGLNIAPATDQANLLFRVGTGGGPTYDAGGDYYGSAYTDLCSNSTAAKTNLDAAASANMLVKNIGNASGGYANAAFSFRFVRPQSTTVMKYIMHGGSTYHDGIGVFTGRFGGLWASLTAATAFRFLFSSGNIAAGDFRLLGIPKT